MNGNNETWDLKSFVESLTAELDRAQDLLRVKSVNRPLTYSVQDVAFNLNVFAEYDGENVLFRTARPNESSSSTIELKLGSVTDRVIDETTRQLPKAGERLEDMEVPGLDRETRSTLERLGADSVEEVKKLGRRKVKVKSGRGDVVDFGRLAAMMERAGAPRERPQVKNVAGFRAPSGPRLRIFGSGMGEVMADRVFHNGVAVQASVTEEYVELALPDDVTAGELAMETIAGERLLVRLTD